MKTQTTQVRDYLDSVSSAIFMLDAGEVEIIIDYIFAAIAAGNKVLVCGNGGSSASAAHFVVDVSQVALKFTGQPIRALCLSDNTPSLTAIANDLCYEDVFSDQIRVWGDEGDVLICISGSGMSKNILRAASCGKEYGLTIVGLTGCGGGKLKDLSDLCLIVNSDDMQIIEDAHLSILHCIFREIVRRVREEKLEETEDAYPKLPNLREE